VCGRDLASLREAAAATRPPQLLGWRPAKGEARPAQHRMRPRQGCSVPTCTASQPGGTCALPPTAARCAASATTHRRRSLWWARLLCGERPRSPSALHEATAVRGAQHRGQGRGGGAMGWPLRCGAVGMGRQCATKRAGGSRLPGSLRDPRAGCHPVSVLPRSLTLPHAPASLATGAGTSQRTAASMIPWHPPRWLFWLAGSRPPRRT